MSLSELLTISSSFFLFDYSIFKWNNESIITYRAINYIKTNLDFLAEVADEKHGNVDGAWADRWQRLQASIIGSGANLIFLSSLLKYVIRRIHNSVICKMCSTQVLCPKCGSDDIKNFGYSKHNEPRYFCCNDE